jgi:hypothetical protein
MTLHSDPVFAPIDQDLSMERIAGGNETEVYRSDDHRFVAKIKGDTGGSIAEALVQARMLRAAADRFVACLGPEHSLPNSYLISRNQDGQAQVIAVQPFVGPGQALFDVDYGRLSEQERAEVADQLRNIIRRSLEQYRHSGEMPDLYGRSSSSSAERLRMKQIGMLPRRVWSFLVERNLLRSHNLMLVRNESIRIVLVDYDPVRRGRFYRMIYYLVRWALFFRDHALILLLRQGGKIPHAN